MGFLKKSYMNLPPATRGLVTLVGVGVGLYIVYKIYKSVSGTLSGETTQAQASSREDRNWASEADKLNQNPATKASITNAQALSYAAVLFACMDGYGTDEEQIYGVFRNIKNDADFAMIQNAYGVREISSGSWNPEPNFKGTLSGALTNELSASEKVALNNILAQKKITYRA
jgi:hypothetical protein